MLNVLIRDHDALYMSSLKLFLSELFLSHYQRDVHFLPVFDVENVSKADVIIIGFGPGEFYTCTPELRFRKKSIIIGIVDHEKETPGVIKTCTHDIVFIRRDLSLKDLQRKIRSLWSQSYKYSGVDACRSCCVNKCNVLSLQQMRIMSRLSRGQAISDIARELSISNKTVYSQKHLVMNKYQLSSNFELLMFLENLQSKNRMDN